jgi:hypothetical protein
LRPLSRLAGILGIPLDLEDMSTKAHSSYDVDHEHNVSSPLSASSRPLSLIEYSELRRGERKERARRDFLAREAEVDRQRAVTDTYAQ